MTINEELLKSAELTGLWEKKLREIEKRTYDAKQFLDELKEMVRHIVSNVMNDNKLLLSDSKQTDDALLNSVCPICGKGTVIKGKTAYGCSEWKSGCNYRKPF